MPCHHFLLLRFHLYVIGTEECERSIAQSAVNASKRVWEAFLSDVLGPMYVPLRSHTLQVLYVLYILYRAQHNITLGDFLRAYLTNFE